MRVLWVIGLELPRWFQSGRFLECFDEVEGVVAEVSGDAGVIHVALVGAGDDAEAIAEGLEDAHVVLGKIAFGHGAVEVGHHVEGGV